MFENKFPYTDFHEMNLDWILKMVKMLGLNVEELRKDLETFGDDIKAQIDYLLDWVNNYDTSFAISIIKQYLATMIFVEINDAGFIVYNIPDSWDEIEFNTTDLDIVVPGVDYGHLVLSY